MSMTDEGILAEMKSCLKDRGQWDMWVDADEAKRYRSLGRRAGRELGWKIATRALPATNGTGRERVFIILMDSTPLHQQLLRVRGQKQIMEYLNRLGTGK